MPACKDCGFLVLVDKDSSCARPADNYTRSECCYMGQLGRMYHVTNWACQVNAKYLAENAIIGSAKGAMEAISVEHDCDKHMDWHPSKSPKEHEDMTIVEKVESINRRYREEDIQTTERRHRETLKWQKQVEGNLDTRFLEGQKTLERQHGSRLVLQFLFALLAAAVTLIGAKIIPWLGL